MTQRRILQSERFCVPLCAYAANSRVTWFYSGRVVIRIDTGRFVCTNKVTLERSLDDTHPPQSPPPYSLPSPPPSVLSPLRPLLSPYSPLPFLPLPSPLITAYSPFPPTYSILPHRPLLPSPYSFLPLTPSSLLLLPPPSPLTPPPPPFCVLLCNYIPSGLCN